MENALIAQWVFGLFTAFAGVLAIGKLLAERDEARGYCNVRFRKKKQHSDWFESHTVKRQPINERDRKNNEE